MKKAIEIKDLSFSYGNHSVFDKLSLNINEGSFLTIIGPNGSGKSTLARILVALEPMTGDIKIDGLFLNGQNINDINKVMGILFENPDFVTNTVREELSFPLENMGLDMTSTNSRIATISKKLGITELLESNLGELSVGEKQIISLASTLISTPKILIIDEGLSMIDGVTRKKIFNVLSDCNKKGLTILNITHDNEEILYGTDLLIISDGKVVSHKPNKEAFKDEKIFTSNSMELPFIADLSTKLRYYGATKKIHTEKTKLVGELWK